MINQAPAVSAPDPGREATRGPDSLARTVRLVGWVVAVAIGAIMCWADRYKIAPDGVSYLDIATAYARGDWGQAINGQWSPLYSWVLAAGVLLFRPSPFWEFPVVQVVNFTIYVFSLVCFEFFLREFLLSRRRGAAPGWEGGGGLDWAWRILGYSLFIFADVRLIYVSNVNPDMLVAALMYVAAGVLLRMRRGGAGAGWSILLGVTLGFSYLAKVATLPVSFIILALALLRRDARHGFVRRASLTGAAFALVAAPYMVALSLAMGRFSVGEAGRLNYAWWVNGVPSLAHWRGGPEGFGTPVHPTRQLMDSPALFEFATPVGGTYPVWYDASYWYEGVKTRVEPGRHAELAFRYLFFRPILLVVPVAGLLALAWLLRKRWLSLDWKSDAWALIPPSAATLGMYAIVYIEGRYVAPSVLLGFLGVLGCFRFASQVLLKGTLLASAAVVALASAPLVSVQAARVAADLTGRAPVSHPHWAVAQGLRRAGVREGDSVGSIGDSFEAYWARLARVRIIAEIPAAHPHGRGLPTGLASHEAGKFWKADAATQARAMSIFAKTGAAAVIADSVPSGAVPPGWRAIGSTGYYVYELPLASQR